MTSEEYGQEAFIRGESDLIKEDYVFQAYVNEYEIPPHIAMIDWEIGYAQAHLAKIEVDKILKRM